MACANLLPECTYLCCSWKAPRVFSGWFASTTQSQGQIDEKRWRKSLSRSSAHASNCSDCTVHRKWNRNKFEDCFTEDAHGFPVAKIYRRQKKGSRTLFRCGSGLESQNTSEKITPDTLWEDLRPTISYLSSMQLGMVWDALQLAFEAHEGQKRKSGEPYIIHPVEVARILGELELDWESIAAGLLHDTVEDTNVVTFERIEEQFGPAVRRIVEGETKVSKLGKLQCASTETVSRDVKADDLRQMFLAMTEEVRVIIVKLADRLHNMRTLMHMPPHKQRYIALETLQVFAPLARLLGMYKIKSELEDLSFMYAHPEDYASLKKRVNEVYQEHEEEALEAKRSLLQRIGDDQFLGFMSVDVRVHALCKELYSIYKKLLESKGSIYEVQDITQLRIILQEKPRATGSPLSSSLQICYHVLGLVHQMWTPVPQSMKDYIATPKPNGYQSLHTKVLPFLYGNTFRLEVQIRTEEMDILAKRGIAAHYSGKVSCQALLSETCASKGSTNFWSNADLARRVSWLNAIREWQEEFVGNMTAREFVDTVTGDLLGSRVFVFTPKGEIKNLPKGATVVDYAYQIHTELGNKMVAAKVNGNLVSPAHTLANAEVVEVITYNGLSTKSVFQKHRQWLQYARTRSARHKITKFLKEQAALSADDITADAIKEFISGLGEVCMETLDNLSTMEVPNNDFDPRPKQSPSSGSPSLSATLENVKSFLAGDIFPSKIPHVNGKHNKKAEEMAVKFTGTRNFLSSGTPRFIAKPAVLDLLSMDEAAMIGLESWQTLRVGLWHEKRKQSIQWFSVLCIDRSSMLAEVTAILGAAGIVICGCAAEADQIKGLGIMLFHVDGSTEDMMNACASIDSIEGVLSWSVGCSWPRTQTPSTLYL